MNSNFLKGETWGFPAAAVEHIETHAAHVFLVAGRAFKIKKPVKLPYLDFSSLERRRAVLAHELAVNRAYAPTIYREVIEVEGEPVLVMNRFDRHDVLASYIDRHGIDSALAAKLAETAAEAHAIAPVAGAPGAAIMAELGLQLSRAFTASPDIFHSPETLEFHALFEEALQRLKPLLNRRGEKGLVRRCHGDMHCSNIVLIGGKPTLFDAIEFSERIATVDVLYDLAFLIMDLLRHGRSTAANIVLNRYLDLRRDAEDLSGLAALPLFLATRAGVRALVAADLLHELPANASQKQRGEALDYFRASLAFLKPARPELVCVGGLSGTGKSVLGSRLAPELGAAPGALHIRSDIERKVQAGVPETQRLRPEHYAPAASVKVYGAILARAEAALAAGQAVVLDAVFAQESERRAAQSLAQRRGIAFLGLWLEADAAILKSRVNARRNDASDATADVIDRQLRYDLGRLDWTRIDAGGSTEDTYERVMRVRQSSGRAA
ncbi:MAG: bifunctional aminoglycoside phosphotransferase/ATP-binding protein [Hyphomicrobiales bacterium]